MQTGCYSTAWHCLSSHPLLGTLRLHLNQNPWAKSYKPFVWEPSGLGPPSLWAWRSTLLWVTLACYNKPRSPVTATCPQHQFSKESRAQLFLAQQAEGHQGREWNARCGRNRVFNLLPHISPAQGLLGLFKKGKWLHLFLPSLTLGKIGAF